jgi:hypothetical protein
MKSMDGRLFLTALLLLSGCGNGGKEGDADADAGQDPDPVSDDAELDGELDATAEPDADAPADADVTFDVEVDSVTVCEGNCHYVREGAAGLGDGTDWDNAWTGLPDTLERGHVYFVADGSYSAYTFDDSESGDAFITVKKATAFDPACTETAGWDSGYGDGQALFQALVFASGRFEVDGVVGQNEQPRGFEILSDAPADESPDLVVIDENVTHVTLRHLDIHRPSMDYRASGIYAARGGNSDIVVAHCHIHDIFGVHFYFIGSDGVLIEHSWMARNKSTAEWHSESIQARGVTNMTVRYCWFEDIQGTGVIVSGSGNSAGWEIYGNVFNGLEVGHGAVADNMNDSITNVHVYNNTILRGGGHSGIRFFNSAGGNAARNNLWYDCGTVIHEGVDYDTNYYSDCGFTYAFEPGPNEPPKDGTGIASSITDDPFVDSAGRDFHLTAPLDGWPGDSLDAAYGSDFDGLTRGADGVWDRGAFEYEE